MKDFFLIVSVVIGLVLILAFEINQLNRHAELIEDFKEFKAQGGRHTYNHAVKDCEYTNRIVSKLEGIEQRNCFKEYQ